MNGKYCGSGNTVGSGGVGVMDGLRGNVQEEELLLVVDM